MLAAVLVLWALFGSWLLLRPGTPEVSGLDPAVGHVVVFLFVSLAGFGMATYRFGTATGLGIGVAAMVVAAGVSEWLQPIVTDTRQSQRADLIANGAGIAGALLVSVVLVVLVRGASRRAWITAGLCMVGFVASGAVTVFGFEDVRVAWECRNLGYRPIPGVDGSPIIHADGDQVALGASRRQADDTVAPRVSIAADDGLIASDSRDLRCAVLRAGGFTVVATVVPESGSSDGPTRIFTSSIGTNRGEINTHIGQDFDELSVRHRARSRYRSEFVPLVFAAGRSVTVAVAFDGVDAAVFVDGIQRTTFELQSSFLDWDPDFPVLIGDEATGDRTFQGEIVTLSVYDRALAPGDPLLG